MNRLQKLNECLEIARKFNNPDMEEGVLRAIEEEIANPSTDTYPDPTDD
jgi:hypothetical protein